MGQAAVDSTQIERQVLLADVHRFMAALGFAPQEWERRPAMEPVVMVKVSERRSTEFERLATSVRILGSHRLECTHVGHGVFRLHPGVIQDAKDEFCEVGGRRVRFTDIGFANVVIEDEAGQSAYHVREGSLILYPAAETKKATSSREAVSTLEIAPAILGVLGIDAPSYMVNTRIAAA
jgi:hypothetical protein